jgi:hypothetical protein
MNGQNKRDAIGIWIMQKAPLSDEMVDLIFDKFFMTELPTNEATLWKLYRKSLEMKWYRKGRLATKKEVELGISDLKGEPIYGSLADDIYTWIVMCTGKGANKHDYNEFMTRIKSLCERAEEFTENIAKLKKAKPVKYVEFEPDEKDSDVDIVTVMAEVLCRYNKYENGDDQQFRKAVSVSLKYSVYEHPVKDMLTQEKVVCRKVYEELMTKPNQSNHKSAREEKSNRLREDCETILSARGKELEKGAFVYKIIDTLRLYNYSRCSEKQKKIIDDALAEIYKKREGVEEVEEKQKNKELSSLISEVQNNNSNDMFGIDLNDIF